MFFLNFSNDYMNTVLLVHVSASSLYEYMSCAV
jgi:hypothetical protein